MPSAADPTEIRITVSVGPRGNILGHLEVAIVHHVEKMSALSLQESIESALSVALAAYEADGEAR